MAAEGGADLRMSQSREAHLAAWPLHSPEGGQVPAPTIVLTLLGRSSRRTLGPKQRALPLSTGIVKVLHD
jgi:hypothetical protein